MSWKRKLTTVKSWKPDASSVSPLLERLEEFWVVSGFEKKMELENGVTLLVGMWWRENKNKLVEWKALVDTVRIKSADLEDKIFFSKFCGFPNCLDVGKGCKLPYAV